MGEWQDIASAPADRDTVVLLWYPDIGRMTMGITYAYGDGSVGASSDFKGSDPSYWMPLPAPPLPAPLVETGG